MLKPAQRQEKIERTPLYTDGVRPFPPHLYSLLPKAVRAANEAHEAARERLAAAEAQATARRVAAEQAQETDRQAAREAVEAGKTPPKSTVPAALDALERAQRAAEAARELARDTQAAFIAAVLADLDEIVGNIADRQAQLRDTLNARMDEMHAGITEIQALDHLTRELDRGGNLTHGRKPSLTPVHGSRRRDPAEEALAPLRALIAGTVANAKPLITTKAA